MKKRNKDNFWKLYTVCTILAVILLVSGFMVFHSYMEAYETSQPHTAVEEYLASLKNEDVAAMAKSAVDKLEIGYENREDYVLRKLRRKSLSFFSTLTQLTSSLTPP